MTTDNFRSKVENGQIGLKYNKKELFHHILADKIDLHEMRMGIVVAIEIISTPLGLKPRLNFKRLELNKAGGQNLITIDELSNSVCPECTLVDMVTGIDISPSDSIIDSANLVLHYEKDRGDKNDRFHKCLFMINQLKVIKEFSAEEIIFSAAYINYKNSIFNEFINDQNWFTLKVEGFYTTSNNYKVNVETNTHLPIIEVGSPCPPIWHDGKNPV